jgi:hypothetical protein
MTREDGMSDSNIPEPSDRPLINYLKNLFHRKSTVKIPGANDRLQPWLTELKQHLHLYLQARYLDKKPGFFTNLFADSQKQAAFNRLLFTGSGPDTLQELLLHPHLNALWTTPYGRLAIQATYFSIIKPLEGFDPNILKKPSSHPECNALLQQLLKNFAKICAKLDTTHGDILLLPVLKDSYLQLAVVANQTVDISADENMPALYQDMQTKVDLYLAKHPRTMKQAAKSAANDTDEAAQHVVGNTVQFP